MTNAHELLLADSHCHLNFSDYDQDRKMVISRAAEQGVRLMINVGCDLESSRTSLLLADEYENIYATVGLHPHEARHFSDEVEKELSTLADHPKVVAMGETGLDYHRNLSSPVEQERAFRAQIRLSKKKDLPVVIHDREAHEAILSILKDEKVSHGVMHCFSGDWELARKVLDLGLYISLAGVVTFKNAATLQEVARKVPLDRLLIETDAPFLSPTPYRGKRNEPAYLLQTAGTVAALRGISVEELSQRIYDNTQNLFFEG